MQNQMILFSKLKNNRGSILLSSYFLTAALLILGAAFLVITASENKRAAIQQKATQAFYIAEAGLEQVIYELKQEFEVGDERWSDDVTIDGTDYTADTSNFYTVYADEVYPSGSYTHAYSLSADNHYTVSLLNVSGSEDIWLRSTGEVDGVTQTVQAYLRMVNISPWDNAIFGGTGGSGTMINGNVNIYGSVHILGNGLDDGDNAINLGGSAELVGNNYNVGSQGLPSSLKTKIPDLPQVLFNGEMVETLSAELRVKKGIVALSGSSSVGNADSSGNSVKETVDGTFVTDGYGGNKGAANVYSDNGTTTGYDLGNIITFPSLNDPHPLNESQDYYQYFAANGLNLTNELAAITPSSSIDLGDCATNCVYMNADGNLRVEGMVYVSGNNDALFNGGDFEYTGKGTILVTGDVTIDGDFVTSGNDSFPNNVVGFMTPGDIVLGSSSQKDIMGLFYAENEMSTAFQSDIVGTVITNYFDFSGNVPSIFQVPEVMNNLPPGIIGAEAAWYVNVVSWQKCDSHAATCGGV